MSHLLLKISLTINSLMIIYGLFVGDINIICVNGFFAVIAAIGLKS
jgi:hypothetical protein